MKGVSLGTLVLLHTGRRDLLDHCSAGVAGLHHGIVSRSRHWHSLLVAFADGRRGALPWIRGMNVLSRLCVRDVLGCRGVL